MKNLNYYLIIGGFIIWLAETAYFGFNLTPQSNAEEFFDLFAGVMILNGTLLEIMNIIRRPINITFHLNSEVLDFVKNKWESK
jgi:hypothetical protein